ncbi:MAG: NADH-quinone oxidoreductase subunit M [Anaerolineae bacterium]|jgi:NADH-quinone oxidoreductase subunit M|nr:NADH-quinone oxidoreductase subunit M [Anaerolineae bacterium]MDH7474854.1 NADH-quinone oxidoreductase subunit M [Anaerolineae bacterium]
MGTNVLSIITFAPLLGALIILFIPREKENWIRWWAIAISLVPLGLAFFVYSQVRNAPGQMWFQETYEWVPAISVYYRLGVDGISVVMLVLTALLSTLSYFYSAFTIKERVKEYYFLFLLLETGMFGVFVSLDLILFYVFWEIGLVPMYLLIGVWGGERRIYAAIKFFLYTLVGSVALLLAILGVHFQTGTFSILEAGAAHPFADNFSLAALAFWGFFLGFAIKVPSFPFHTWLPDAHTEAPTAGSVVLAGVLLKLGAYGFIRIVLPFFPQVFSFYANNVPIIPILAVISIVYGALVCMAQWDLKRLIAYSSVSHMGYVMLGVSAAAASLTLGDGNGALNTSAIMALNGAALQMFTHGIITGGLFFLVGIIYERAHTRDLRAFGGLASKVPYYYGIMMVTGFASWGLPGLAGFWSEFFVFRGAFRIIPIFTCIGIMGVVLTAAYILWKIVQHMFLGEFSQAKWDEQTHHSSLFDMTWWEKGTMWPLVVIMVLVGLYPSIIVALLNGAMTALLESF